MWKQNVLPLLWTYIANEVDSVTAYLLIYHEAAVANLLEVCTTYLQWQKWIDEVTHCVSASVVSVMVSPHSLRKQ